MSIKSSSSFGRMRRYPDQGWIAGVCAGLADYLGWNLKLVRALFVIAFCMSGFFPVGVLYLLMWYVVEQEPGMAPEPGARNANPAAPPPYRPAPSGNSVSARFARLEERLRDLEECVSSKDFELRREFRKLES